jgi:hypothetical protein
MIQESDHEWQVGDLFQGTIMERLRKIMETSVRTADDLVEIFTEYLLNVDGVCYPYTCVLGNKILGRLIQRFFFDTHFKSYL